MMKVIVSNIKIKNKVITIKKAKLVGFIFFIFVYVMLNEFLIFMQKIMFYHLFLIKKFFNYSVKLYKKYNKENIERYCLNINR